MASTPQQKARRLRLNRKVWAGIHYVRRRRHLSLDAAVLRVAQAVGVERAELLRRINHLRTRVPSLRFRWALEHVSQDWPQPVRVGDW